MPTCHEVADAIATDRLEEAPLRRRLAVFLHLLLCRHCRRYARQMRTIGVAARELLAHSEGEGKSLERLRRALLRSAGPPNREPDRD